MDGVSGVSSTYAPASVPVEQVERVSESSGPPPSEEKPVSTIEGQIVDITG